PLGWRTCEASSIGRRGPPTDRCWIRSRRSGASCRARARSAAERPPPPRRGDGARAPADARRELDSVVAFSGAVTEAGSSADPSVEAFLASLDAGEGGPRFSAWAPRDREAGQ